MNSPGLSQSTVLLRMVKRSFYSLHVEGFRITYTGYIRPRIEYCVQAWCPYLSKDKVILENVWRHAIKYVAYETEVIST